MLGSRAVKRATIAIRSGATARRRSRDGVLWTVRRVLYHKLPEDSPIVDPEGG